jgi:hypothetical protein
MVASTIAQGEQLELVYRLHCLFIYTRATCALRFYRHAYARSRLFVGDDAHGFAFAQVMTHRVRDS